MAVGLMLVLTVGVALEISSSQPHTLSEISVRILTDTPSTTAPKSDARADDQTGELVPEIRVTHPVLRQLLQDGHRRSATLRRLTGELADTGWLVFVHRGACPDRAMLGCLLHAVGRFEGRPYLSVLVNPDYRQHRDNVIATLAHELQHALEAASAPGVTDGATMEALFRRIGRVRMGSQTAITYETEAAQRAGEAVLRDLRTKQHRH